MLALAASAHAGEVLETHVIHDEGQYSVHFDVRLDAPPDRLKHHLTDYDSYASHFEPIKESRVLGRTEEGALRVRMRLQSCVLFFCRAVTVVKEIVEQPDGTITARIDPAASDFRASVERWRIVRESDGTRLQYWAELEPTFYVPPLIGPWLIKREIRGALLSGAEKLEALAHE